VNGSLLRLYGFPNDMTIHRLGCNMPWLTLASHWRPMSLWQKWYVVQIVPDLTSLQGTLDRVLTSIGEPSERGAALIVFPETFLPWYPYFVTVHAPAQCASSAAYVAKPSAAQGAHVVFREAALGRDRGRCRADAGQSRLKPCRSRPSASCCGGRRASSFVSGASCKLAALSLKRKWWSDHDQPFPT
jgi:hypothetical protein